MRSLNDHLQQPYAPALPHAETVIDACAGGSCGDLVRFFLDIDDGVINACAVRARGRSQAVATASALAEAAHGKTVREAATLGLSALHNDFSELEGDAREHALVAEDALHHALGAYVRRSMRDRQPVDSRPDSTHIVVAMSGGVDSAIALHEMHARAAGRVVGVTLRLWIDPQAPDPEEACCSPASVRRARATCHALGVPHITLDLRGDFAQQVVAPFISEYQAGLTPNPCVRCNGFFRMDELIACADAFGATHVATGHYARVAQVQDLAGVDVPVIQRGMDPVKDQSYMLARLQPSTIERLIFPLGERTKNHTRARARELELEQARVGESQEICFLGGADYRSFLERAEALGPAGEIVHTDAGVLGTHTGVARFTPGQRRGLDVAAPARHDGPLYVLDVDGATGTVTVGERRHLATDTVLVRDIKLHAQVARAKVQLRYRSPAVAADVELDGSRATLRLDEPVVRPAAGQTACLYDPEDRVVGCATIDRGISN